MFTFGVNHFHVFSWSGCNTWELSSLFTVKKQPVLYTLLLSLRLLLLLLLLPLPFIHCLHICTLPHARSPTHTLHTHTSPSWRRLRHSYNSNNCRCRIPSTELEHILCKIKAAMCRPVFLKGRCNIPSSSIEETLASPGSQRLSSCSSWGRRFPGFKQCTSSTPPPISRNRLHIDGSHLDSIGGGNKCTLWGVKLADQNRPPNYCLLSKSADLAEKKDSQIGSLLPSIKMAIMCPSIPTLCPFQQRISDLRGW